jgi:Fe-Mn family superoxide dismutase
MAFKLPDLPYDYDALEPHIDERTMRIHHTKHHQGYTNKLNAALEGYDDLQDHSIEELLSGIDNIPADIQTAVRNNGGGFANHRLFWTIMSPNGGGKPTGALAKAIDADFGSFEAFKEKFKSAATGRFGSGWAWVTADTDGSIEIVDTPNQDSPLMHGKTPIMGIDVWEHAYYLHYQNERGSYIDHWWHVVDWDAVNDNYETVVG